MLKINWNVRSSVDAFTLLTFFYVFQKMVDISDNKLTVLSIKKLDVSGSSIITAIINSINSDLFDQISF